MESNFITDLTLVGLSSIFLILEICLPLLPAILIYKIFPDTSIQTDGTIGALSWKASGAFAAYLIVLAVIMLSPLNKLKSTMDGFYHPAWTIEVEIHGYDHESQPINFENIDVDLKPGIHRVSSKTIKLTLPGLKRSKWPVAHFQVEGGATDINLASLEDDEIEIDHNNKHVKIIKPVIIKKMQISKKEYPAPGSDYIN